MAELTALDITERILKMRADIQQQYATQARQRASIVSHQLAMEKEEVNIAAASEAITKIQGDLDKFIQAHGDPTAGSN